MIISMRVMVVLSVAIVCGSTTALRTALQRALKPWPKLVMTRDMMKSHGPPEKAMSSPPKDTNTNEMRARTRSLFTGRDLKREVPLSKCDAMGRTTSRHITVERTPTVEIYVA
jgi:hypothetical protein